MRRIGSTLEASDMRAEEWLKRHDPRHRDRNQDYPYHSPKQARLRRKREICCGLMDSSIEHIQEAFVAYDMGYPRFK
jgi:hypothetical protein